MLQLIEENSVIDPTYVEDFLLTHRTFIKNSMEVANQLLDWFNEPSARDRVTRVVLLWVNNHFTDFEMDPVMMDFVEKFEACLEENKMGGQLRLLNIACAAKARTRCVTLARPSRDQVLHFSILGGYERGFGIFISKVCITYSFAKHMYNKYFLHKYYNYNNYYHNTSIKITLKVCFKCF